MKIGMMVALLATTVSGAAISQDVLMRRPLPHRATGGAEIPSETSAPTPAPAPAPAPTPSPPPADGEAHQAFVASATCSGGYTFISCLDGSLDNGQVTTRTGTYQNCRQQNQTADWTRISTDLAGRGIDVVAPSKIYSRQGAACGPEAPADQGSFMTYAEQCVEGSPVCMEVSYSVDGSNVPTLDNFQPVPEWDTGPDGGSYCDMDHSTPASVGRLLKEAGLSQTHDSCEAPQQPDANTLYAARSQCVTAIKYAPGWPTSGGVDVTTNLLVTCYALSGLDGDAPTATRATEKQCSNQNPTAEQKAVLASLSPDYLDYQTMDRTCSVKGGVNLNLQIKRDNVAYGSRLLSGTRGNRNTVVFETKERFVYACTDIAKSAGDYEQPYFARNNPYGTDAYPSDKGNCPAEKLSNMALIQQGWRAGDIDQSGERDTKSKITVQDLADQSQFEVTKVSTVTLGEECSGGYAGSEICYPDTDGVVPVDLDGNGIPDAQDWGHE